MTTCPILNFTSDLSKDRIRVGAGREGFEISRVKLVAGANEERVY